MRKIEIYLFIILLSINASLLARDNNSLNNSRHRIGLITGFGYQGNLNVKYGYEVNFFQLQYYTGLLPDKKTWGLDILIQPQYNLTKFKKIDAIPILTNGFEFGINVGILIHKSIFKDFWKMYACISIGPHYVSATPQRQAAGFTFSDNFFVGSNIKLFRKSYLDLRYGFRHISNAGLITPNGGINNLIISGGILINL